MSGALTIAIFRISLAAILLYTAFNTLLDPGNEYLKNINQSIGYYYNKFEFMKSLQLNHPLIYEELDSIITKGISILGFWAGVSILLGSQNVGGLVAMIHSLLMIIFRFNWWTPKATESDDISYFILMLGELIGAFLITYKVQPEIPVVIMK